ncbi:MAG: peptidoglycan editing factor PgeF [Gammaproteobacteria bacterium]|jgi:YfiH family protein
MAADWISADWPAPPRVRAGTTSRGGGVSRPPFDSLNLARHVGDDPEAVARNRAILQGELTLPGAPLWLEQTHSNRVIGLPEDDDRRADAAVTDRPGLVCAVLTADCVPVLLCNRGGTRVGAVHVGWRGLCKGILENTLDRMDEDPAALLAWLGPHIGAAAYEVGDDVRDACLARLPGGSGAFTPNPRGRWQCSLDELISLTLRQRGLTCISRSGHCTFTEPGQFYSYRREARTGRMASLIWMDES